MGKDISHVMLRHTRARQFTHFPQHHFVLIEIMLSLHDSFTDELQLYRNATDSEALPSAQLAAKISASYSL